MSIAPYRLIIIYTPQPNFPKGTVFAFDYFVINTIRYELSINRCDNEFIYQYNIVRVKHYNL